MNRKIKLSILYSLIVSFFLSASDYVEVLNKGILLLKQRQYEESLKTLEEAQKISPENSNTYYYLGEVFYNIGKTDKAIDNYKRAIEIQSSIPEYYLSLAMVYLSVNSVEDSLENLNKVLEISPNTLTGKKANKLKKEISSSIAGRELVKKWVKLEEEERLRLKESESKSVSSDETSGEMEGEMEGGAPKKRVKEDIKKVVRKIKFETETKKRTASSLLSIYFQDELREVVEDLIEVVNEEKDLEVRKNVLLALGKTGSPEAIELLIKMLQNSSETYDIRIVVLEALSNINTEEVVTAERNTLNKMLLNREKERQEAQKKIGELQKRISNWITKRDEINLKAVTKNEELEGLNMKLQEATIPSDMGEDQPRRSSVTAKDLAKLRADIKTLEGEIVNLTLEVRKIDKSIERAEQQKLKYENLLLERDKKKDIIIQMKEKRIDVDEDDMPPDGYREGGYVETDEDKNEIIFAITLIKTLGKMRNIESLGIIKKSWEEYGIEQQLIYYYLSLARLSDFTGIDMLVSKLRSDYPAEGVLKEDLSLRSGIIEVLGDYLVNTPNIRLVGLLEYLSEEAGYPEIKKAATGALSKITQKSK